MELEVQAQHPSQRAILKEKLSNCKVQLDVVKSRLVRNFVGISISLIVILAVILLLLFHSSGACTRVR